MIYCIQIQIMFGKFKWLLISSNFLAQIKADAVYFKDYINPMNSFNNDASQLSNTQIEFSQLSQLSQIQMAVTTQTTTTTKTTLTVPICANSQVLLNNVCIECNSFMYGCNQCSLRADADKTVQCDVCDFGLYILNVPKKQNSSILVPNLDDIRISFCVKRCEDFAHNFVSNPGTMKCEYCGDECQLCSSQYGCLDSSHYNHGSRMTAAQFYTPVFPFNTSGPPSTLFNIPEQCKDNRCDQCQTLNSQNQSSAQFAQCDSCFGYVNVFSIFPQPAICELCDVTTVANCKQCDPKFPSVCLFCKDDFYIDCITNYCFACSPEFTRANGCARCQQYGCEECLTGYYLDKDPITGFQKCFKCDLTAHNSQYLVQPDRCVQCVGKTAQNQCKFCKIGFLGSNAGNPLLCELKCGSNQFPQTTFANVMENENSIVSMTCISCPKQCLTCIGSAAGQCTSCPSGFYLAITDFIKQSGNCSALIGQIPAGQTTNFDIYVTNVQPKTSVESQHDLLKNSADIGTWVNPFWNFQDALIRAQELAAPYQFNITVSVTIHLFAGNHYIIDDRGSTLLYYKPTMYWANDNQNYSLVIKPLRCDLVLNILTSDICLQSSSSQTVFLFNKQREKFKITVGLSVTLDHVIIDSLDSILHTITAGLTKVKCLNEYRQCCTIQSGTTQVTNFSTLDAATFSCENSFKLLANSMEFDCFANWPRSLFQMKLSDSRLLQSQNKLILSFSKIQNIFFAMNSLVSFTPVQGNVSFTNSSFNQISICGGLVKTSLSNLGLKPDITAALNNEYLSAAQISKVVEIWSYQDKLKVDPSLIYYGDVPSQSNPVCSTTSSCYSVNIDSCTFTNMPFGYSYANTKKSLLVNEENGLRDLGKILTMKGLSASVKVSKSTFSNLSETYDGCQSSYTLETPVPANSFNNFRQLFNSRSSSGFASYQIKSLFSLKQFSGSIEFTGNTFTKCVTYKGIFDIDLVATTTSFVLNENQFTQNAAIMGSNILSFQRKANLALTTCGNAIISKNIFKQNIGCSETSGIAQMTCLDNQQQYVGSTDTRFTLDSLVMTRLNSLTDGTGDKISFENNTIQNNFAGTNKAIILIEGFPNVQFSKNTLTDNENWIPSGFIDLSPIYAAQTDKTTPSILTSIKGYSIRAKSIISTRATNYLSFNGDSYINNYVIDDYDTVVSLPLKQSNGILITQAAGTFSMNGLNFSENKGVRGSLFATNISSQIGFRTKLISFESTSFTQFTFNNMTFTGNKGYTDTTQKSASIPQLFTILRQNFADPNYALTIANLSLQSNIFSGADYLVDFTMMKVFLQNLNVANNIVNTILLFRYPNDTAMYWITNSIFTQNYVDSGAVVKTVENPGFIVTFGSPSFIKVADASGVLQTVTFQNLFFQDSSFVKNSRDISLVSINQNFKTSCIEIQGGSTEWLQFGIESTIFDSNVGRLTNEIFFDQSLSKLSIGSNAKGIGSQWTINVDKLSDQLLAQVIYRPKNSKAKISVQSSTFKCSTAYSSKIVLAFNEALTIGRVALFRIEQSSTNVHLNQITNKLTRNQSIYPGLLDGSQFTSQFQNNVYSSCNNFFQGSVYYLANGGQVRDLGSSFSTNSALYGGIGFVTGDGSYLQLESNLSALSLQSINAYYGGIVYAQDGATAVLQNNLTIRRVQAYEGAVAYAISRSRIVIRDRINISDNKVFKRSLVVALDGSQFWVANATISANEALEDTAIIYSSNNRPMQHLLDGSVNTQSGVSLILQSIFEYSTVTNTIVDNGGRLITAIESNLVIEGVNFASNDQIYDETYGIHISSSDVQIKTCNFQGPSQNTFLTKLYFPKIKAVYGGFLSIFQRSKVTVDKTIFNVARSINGGCVLLMSDSDATFTSCEFTQCAANLGGAIYASGHKNLEINSSKFDQNIAYQGYGQNIYSINCVSNFKLRKVELTSYYNSIFTSGFSLQVTDVTMSLKSDSPPLGTIPFLTDGGGFYILETLVIEFTGQNTFTKLKARYGGAIYLKTSLNSVQALQEISNNVQSVGCSMQGMNFDSCTSELDGGAIYLMNPINMKIFTSSFKKCSAGTSMTVQEPVGEGGAIYFGCSIKEEANVAIKANQLVCGLDLKTITFTGNSALNGGAILWNYKEPTTDAVSVLAKTNFSTIFNYGSLVFDQNKAKVYGPEIAGVALRLIQFKSETQYLQYYFNQTDPLRQLPILDADVIKWYGKDAFDGVQSGGLIPTRYYGLVDKYNQIVSTNKGEEIRLSIINPESYTNQAGFLTDLIGVTSFYSAYGTYNMSGIGLLTGPGNIIKARLKVSSIDLSNPSNIKYLSKALARKIQSPDDYFIEFQMITRNCTVGEGLKPSGACFSCPSGTFLLIAPVNATECDPCPKEKAFCEGGSNIGPRPGYWRSSNISDTFYSCFQPNACLGMQAVEGLGDINITSEKRAVGVCNTTAGYSGAICSACLPGFKRSGLTGCKKCSDKYEIYFTVATLVVFVVGIILFVKITIDGAEKEDMQSVFNKVMMNHLQMLIIFSGLDINWPPQVNKIFSAAAPIKLVTSAVVSFDCFMDTRMFGEKLFTYAGYSEPEYLDPYYFMYPRDMEGKRYLPIIYIKLCILAVLPIVLIIVSYFAWSVILRIQGKREEHYTRFIATMAFLLFIIHPSLTQSMIDFFNCKDYGHNGETVNRMVTDLQIICWKDPFHNMFTFYVALPCLILWGLGIPATILVLMRKESDKLETIAAKQKFGFFYNGYKRNNYFWEIVIMYRKILCIFIAVLLKVKGIILQAMVLLIVLLFFLQANSSRRPFLNRALNDIENLSLMSQLITIFCGIFFLSAKDPNSESFDKNKDFSLDPITQYIFFIVIAGINLLFILVWLLKLQDVIKDNLMSRFPKIYTTICLWGRIDRWKDEVQKRAKDKKKEAIIQNIENVTLFMNDMKEIYINDIFYEDHNRFLKLLYYIASERGQINLKEKKHNYYIQGPMARHRQFDRDRQNDIQNERTLEIDENFIDQMERQRPKKKKVYSMPKNPFLSTLIKLKRMKIDKEEDENRLKREAIAKTKAEAEAKARKQMKKMFSIDEESLYSLTKRSDQRKLNQMYKGQLTSVAAISPTIMEEGSPQFYPQPQVEDDLSSPYIVEEDDDGTAFNESSNQKQSKDEKTSKKKKKKRADVPDIQANLYKSRNLRSAIRKEQKAKRKVKDFKEDGSRFDPSLPEHFRGFPDYTRPEGEADSRAFGTIDSIDNRLFYIRHLTERDEIDRKEQLQQKLFATEFQDKKVEAETDDKQTSIHSQIGGPSPDIKSQKSSLQRLQVVYDHQDPTDDKNQDVSGRISRLSDEENKQDRPESHQSAALEIQVDVKSKPQEVSNRLRPLTMARRQLANMIFVEDQPAQTSGSFESLEIVPLPDQKSELKIDQLQKQSTVNVSQNFKMSAHQQNHKAAASYFGQKTKDLVGQFDGPVKYSVRIKKDKPSHMLEIPMISQNGEVNLPVFKYSKDDRDYQLPVANDELSSFHTDPSMQDFDDAEDPGEFQYVNRNVFQVPRVVSKLPLPTSILEASERQESLQDDEEFVDMGDGLSGGGVTEFNGIKIYDEHKLRKSSKIDWKESRNFSRGSQNNMI